MRSDLGYFKGVGEATAGVVAFGMRGSEDLGLAGEAAEGAGMQDAADIAVEWGNGKDEGRFREGALR